MSLQYDHCFQLSEMLDTSLTLVRWLKYVSQTEWKQLRNTSKKMSQVESEKRKGAKEERHKNI